MAETYEQTTLPNGIRVVTERMPHSHSVSIGFWVLSGPIYERVEQAGISHFVEHMLFKGTRNRSARQINESLYPVGGHLNAFTDRELTCFTALVLHEHVGMAMEVLSDMLVNSVFAGEEVVKERNVVLEEIRAIEDTPEDLVHDIFASTIWPDHPLGRPVIGDACTVASFERATVLDYVGERYTPDNVLISAAGKLTHKRFVRETERWLGRMSGQRPISVPTAPAPVAGRAIIQRKTEQAHLCLGMPAFQQADDDNYPLIILDTVLGGGPHSRLFDEIRENQGLAYNVGSGVNAYADAGVLTIFASTGVKNLAKLVTIVHEQLDRVVQEGLTEAEIDDARRHIRASLLLSHESTGSRMGRLANSLIYFGRIVPYLEVIDKLNAVTQADVLRVARKVLRRDQAALAVIGPISPKSRQADQLRAA